MRPSARWPASAEGASLPEIYAEQVARTRDVALEATRG